MPQEPTERRKRDEKKLKIFHNLSCWVDGIRASSATSTSSELELQLQCTFLANSSEKNEQVKRSEWTLKIKGCIQRKKSIIKTAKRQREKLVNVVVRIQNICRLRKWHETKFLEAFRLTHRRARSFMAERRLSSSIRPRLLSWPAGISACQLESLSYFSPHIVNSTKLQSAHCSQEKHWRLQIVALLSAVVGCMTADIEEIGGDTTATLDSKTRPSTLIIKIFSSFTVMNSHSSLSFASLIVHHWLQQGKTSQMTRDDGGWWWCEKKYRLDGRQDDNKMLAKKQQQHTMLDEDGNAVVVDESKATMKLYLVTMRASQRATFCMEMRILIRVEKCWWNSQTWN